MPRSMPANRRWFILPPRVACRISPARPRERRTIRPWSRAATASRGSHSCAATGPGLGGPAHFPHPGHPRPGQEWQSEPRGKTAGPPQTRSQRHPPDQPGMTMQPLGTPAPWWIHGCRCPLHDRYRGRVRPARHGHHRHPGGHHVRGPAHGHAGYPGRAAFRQAARLVPDHPAPSAAGLLGDPDAHPGRAAPADLVDPVNEGRRTGLGVCRAGICFEDSWAS